MNDWLNDVPNIGQAETAQDNVVYEGGSPSSYILTLIIGLVIWLVGMYIYTHDYDHDWQVMDKVIKKYDEHLTKANVERNNALKEASDSRWMQQICQDDLDEYQKEFGIKAP